MRLQIESPAEDWIAVRLPVSWWREEWHGKHANGAERYGGPTFFCRSVEDTNYQKSIERDARRAAAEESAKQRGRRKRGAQDEEAAVKILASVFSGVVVSTTSLRFLIRDWKWLDDSGEPIPFNDQEFQELFDDETLLPDAPAPFYSPRGKIGEALRRWVVREAKAETDLRQEAQAEGEDEPESESGGGSASS